MEGITVLDHLAPKGMTPLVAHAFKAVNSTMSKGVATASCNEKESV